MKKRLIKIWGIGLTTILLVSLLLAAAPVSAGTLSFSIKSGADIPSTSGEVLAEGTSLIDMAVSADGQTIYVVADNLTADKLFKSTDGGDSWSEVTLPSALATILAFVAIAPDDDDIVVIASATSVVYASVNGGSSWNTLGTVQGGDAEVSAIYDLAISPLSASERYIAVAGESSSTNDAGLWYFNLGASAPVWKDAMASADFTGGQPAANSDIDMIRAVAFSPNFASDQTILAISEETGADSSVAGSIRYHSASFNQLAWDTTEFGTPVVLESSTDNVCAATYAEISIDPEYLGGDDATRTVFIGLTVNKAGAEAGGIYRVKNTTLRQEKTDTGIFSIAWDGTDVVAGASLDNNVYRSADALASSPTYSGSRSMKEIGVDGSGDDNVIVRWSGNDVIGVKSLDASSFAKSTDNGKVWNETALMDTALTTMLDFATSSDGTMKYLLSADGGETSLFLETSGTWQRIFVIAAGDTDWIVRPALDDSDTIYIADTGNGDTLIYYTADGGLVKWTVRTSRYDIADLAVQDEDIAYVANYDNDEVSKTTNGGFTWGTDVDSRLSGGSGRTLALIAPDNLLIGSSTGYVAYTSDGNGSWGRISTQLSVSGIAQATADGLADGGYIYAVTSGADTLVQRWEIGQTGTTWKDLAAPVGTSYTGTGLILNGTVLYALAANTSDNDSALYRTLDPTTATPAGSKWVTVASADEEFTRTPSAMKLSSGSTILWAIDDVGEGLWSLTDTLGAGLEIELLSPADGFQNPVNPVSGNSQDISFKWTRPSSGTTLVAYEVRIKASDGTTALATGIRAATDSSAPNLLMGPNQDSPEAIEFAPGQTYYWQVRATTPIDSPWSALRSFSIQTLSAAVPSVLSPANGTEDASTRPSFSWSPIAGASNYQFQLALNPYINAPIVDVNIASTAYRLLAELERGTTYYWRVQATSPVSGDWSAVSNFLVAELPEAAPAAIVIEQLPAPVINIPQAPAQIQPADIIIPAPVTIPAPIDPGYILAVIIIGAVLVIAVIVLIVRTRRVV